MSDLPAVTPDYFQILVVRELRKVGFDVGQPRVHRRSELPEPERGFVLELQIRLSRPGAGGGSTWRAVAACRHQSGSIGRDIVESLRNRLPEIPADSGLVFATPDFTADAVTAAHEAGIALVRLVDGRSAFDMSGWSTPGHYPAWLPAYLSQLIDRDIAGQPRARLLEAGGVDMILESLAHHH